MDDKELIKMLIADRDSWRKMAQDLMQKTNTIHYPWTLGPSTQPYIYPHQVSPVSPFGDMPGITIT
jgi:hypothetical protein